MTCRHLARIGRSLLNEQVVCLEYEFIIGYFRHWHTGVQTLHNKNDMMQTKYKLPGNILKSKIIARCGGWRFKLHDSAVSFHLGIEQDPATMTSIQDACYALKFD